MGHGAWSIGHGDEGRTNNNSSLSSQSVNSQHPNARCPMPNAHPSIHSSSSKSVSQLAVAASL
ncbi:hypothetical protein H6H03_08850 [Nostoc paludosum FACHB-159]|uniref:Uncharacterized protein n=1 Tax=Nostoc paludosum FACHB-159 TaxID=2692908 RepID=A0ABR8K597_9NOSO|nr:hypothetical protein [Nostoc paludosum FACHB-159]